AIIVSKAGFRDNSQLVGVGGSFQQIPIALVPSSGDPPPDPPVVTDLRVAVKNEAGAALPGAHVIVGTLGGTTGSYGTIIFKDIAFAVYNWVVSLQGYHDSTGTVDTTKITDFNVVMVELSQPPPPPIIEHTITVVVKDPKGTAVASVRVRAARLEGGFDLISLTNAGGSVVFKNAPTGDYQIRVLSRSGIIFDEALLFVGQNLTVNLSVVIQWLLKVSSSFGGFIDPSRDTYFADGEVVQVKGTPLPLFKFVEWELDGEVVTDNPVNVEMTADHTIHATFELLEGEDFTKWLLYGAIGFGALFVLTRGETKVVVVKG
ncbi:unnamed protein product, partial [marine sediment metagenome]